MAPETWTSTWTVRLKDNKTVADLWSFHCSLFSVHNLSQYACHSLHPRQWTLTFNGWVRLAFNPYVVSYVCTAYPVQRGRYSLSATCDAGGMGEGWKGRRQEAVWTADRDAGCEIRLRGVNDPRSLFNGLGGTRGSCQWRQGWKTHSWIEWRNVWNMSDSEDVQTCHIK